MLAAAVLLERHIAHAAGRGNLRFIARAVDARQAVGGHHQFGGGVGARAAGDGIAPAQQHDLVLGVRAGARLDDAAHHQAADQHRVAGKGGCVDQRGTQAAVQARIAEGPMQGDHQGRIRHARRKRCAVGGIHPGQLGVGQREIPFPVFADRIAQRPGLRPQVVRPLVTGKCVVAQPALEDVGACAADQRQVTAIVRAVQRNDGTRVIGRACRRSGIDGAIVLQGHGVHAAQGHRRSGARANRRVRQRGRGLVAAERGIAVHARDVFSCAAGGQVADHQIVATAAADAVLPAAVGHGRWRRKVRCCRPGSSG
ncbi:hypothetical protein G6F57_017043 [Rhizopus arrhizus]|nr:hypothetical protein G6F57_017043 [Rhizopus arrhizus]